MAHIWLSNVYLKLGRIDDFQAARDRGLAIDPLNPPLVFATTDRFTAANDYDGAILHISKLLDLPEPPGHTYSMLSNMYASSGRLPDAVSWTKEAIRANGGSTGMGELSYLYDLLGTTADGDYWFEQDEARQSDPLVLLLHQIEILLFRGDLEGAAEKLRRFEARDGFDLEDYPPGIEYYFAPFYARFGRPETGVEMLEEQSGKNGINIAIDDDVYDAIMRLYTLAYAYEKTGQLDNAQITRERALALGDEIGKDRPFGKNPENLFVLAFGFAANGDVENATLTLSEAVASGWRGYYEIINDPFMRDAFSAPEYDAIFNDVKADVDRQRKVVEAANAEHDFRAEFEQLITERSQQQSP
jgi:tetratricopeptide (TPR) repeat protein